MDVSKRFFDGECFFFPCKDIFLADLLGIQHLFEILQTSLTFKYSENVAKSGCFKKRFAMESTTFFRNEGRI